MSRRLPYLAALLVPLALLGCAVGPDYHRPELPAVVAYKELGDWQPSAPADALGHGPWWQIYQDPTLDELEARVELSNQSLRAASAAYAGARAALAGSRAAYWPELSVGASTQRTQHGTSPKQTIDSAQASASWEADVWGRLRRTVESSLASAQASAADLAAARLSLQTALAIDYFELRVQDQLITLLDTTVTDDQQALRIAENRYRAGVAAKADVVTAETQLLDVQAQRLNLDIQRAELEHAIAVLVGQAPASFTLAKAPLTTTVPIVPAGIPSTLLERRPDIASAERQVAAANAGIGVAKSAYFPALTLSGSANFSSNVTSALLDAPARVWAFGPALAATLFDGGARHARVAAARAATEQAADQYRQTVLTALAQVEDSLVNLRVLEQQAEVEAAVVKSAREAEQLTLNQYKAGTVPYSSVITAQTTRLSSEQTALAVLRSRLAGSVTLVGDLGGGWDQSSLATLDQHGK